MLPPPRERILGQRHPILPINTVYTLLKLLFNIMLVLKLCTEDLSKLGKSSLCNRAKFPVSIRSSYMF